MHAAMQQQLDVSGYGWVRLGRYFSHVGESCKVDLPATAVVAVSACYSGGSYVRGPRIDVDLCVSTYSTLKSSSILGAPYMAEGLQPDDTGMGQQCAFQAGPGAIQTKVNDKPS